MAKKRKSKRKGLKKKKVWTLTRKGKVKRVKSKKCSKHHRHLINWVSAPLKVIFI